MGKELLGREFLEPQCKYIVLKPFDIDVRRPLTPIRADGRDQVVRPPTTIPMSRARFLALEWPRMVILARLK